MTDSKARMRRKQPRDSRPGRRVEDPKQAYTPEQLVEVGAIVLIWNQIDAFVDFLIYVSLRPPHLMFYDLARRISGIRAKVELLRLYAERSDILNADARKLIKITLDGVLDYKRYRDDIAHSVPYDIDKGIAHTFKYGTEMVQTLVTIEALNGLYQRLKMLLDELRDVDLLYRLSDEHGAFAVYPEEPDPVGRRRTRDVPLQTARLRETQKRRLSLPPLPNFPDEGISLEEERAE
jgi:hypothetical protein